MAQLLRAAAAVRDYHRESHNLREAAALDIQLSRLSGLDLIGCGPEPRDPHKLQPLRKRPSRTGQGRETRPAGPARPGPALELPRELSPVRRSRPGTTGGK